MAPPDPRTPVIVTARRSPVGPVGPVGRALRRIDVASLPAFVHAALADGVAALVLSSRYVRAAAGASGLAALVQRVGP